MDKPIRMLQKEAHETACSKGWWEEPRTFLECIALIHSELSEAVESYRKFGVLPSTDEITKDDLSVELADALIRIMDMCEYYNLDLEKALEFKMEYNKTRPYRHGGKIA